MFECLCAGHVGVYIRVGRAGLVGGRSPSRREYSARMMCVGCMVYIGMDGGRCMIGPLFLVMRLYCAAHPLQGRYPEAEALYERCQAIYEKALGPDHPSFAATLHSRALVLSKQVNAKRYVCV